MFFSKHYALYLHEVMEWIFSLDVARWLCGSQWKQVVKSLFYICAQQSEKLIWKPFCSWTLSFVIFPSMGFLILQENYFDEFNRVSSKVGVRRAQQRWQQGWCLPLHLCSLCSAYRNSLPEMVLGSNNSFWFLPGSQCSSCNIQQTPIYSHAIFPGWIWVQIALPFQHFGSPEPPDPLLPV